MPTWFIHGTRNGIHHAMCKHMRQVAAENDNITVHIRYSQPRSEDVKGREYDSIGYVGADLLKTLLPGKDMDFYLCSPPPFMNGLLKGLWDWGVPDDRIRFELFGPAALLQEGATARRHKKKTAAGEKAYLFWNSGFKTLIVGIDFLFKRHIGLLLGLRADVKQFSSSEYSSWDCMLFRALYFANRHDHPLCPKITAKDLSLKDRFSSLVEPS